MFFRLKSIKSGKTFFSEKVEEYIYLFRSYLQQNVDSDILGVLGICFFLYIIGIWWGLPSWHGWAPDEIIPKDVFEGVVSLYSGGWYDVYPPLHYYILSVLFIPVFLLFNLLGEFNFADLLDPLTYNSTTGLFHIGYQLLFLISRFTSVLMGVGTTFFVYLCGREIFGKQEALLSALISAFLTPVVYYSKMSNVEMPYIFWFVLSLLFFVRILKHHKLFDYLLFSTAATFSICTKDQAYGLYILTVVYILAAKYIYEKHLNSERNIFQVLFDSKVLASIFTFLILFCSIHNLLFNFDGFISHARLLAGPASYGSVDFLTREDNTLSQHVQLLSQSLRNVRLSLTWPMMVICLLGITVDLIKAKNKSFWDNRSNYLRISLLVPAVSYYVFFVSIVLYSRTRFLIPVCIVMSFFGAKFISDYLFNRKRWILGYKLCSLILVFSLFFYMFGHAFSVNVSMISDSRYMAEQYMDKIIPAGSKVLGIGPPNFKYLPRQEYRQFNMVASKEISEEMLTSGDYDYLITTSAFDPLDRFEPDSPTYKVYKDLLEERLSYKFLSKIESQPQWNFLNLDGASTNLDKLNPTIKIYVQVEKNL